MGVRLEFLDHSQAKTHLRWVLYWKREMEMSVSGRLSLGIWKESAGLYICGQRQLHPNWLVGMRDSLHPTVGQLRNWLYIQVQTYMQETEMAKCSVVSYWHLAPYCITGFYLQKINEAQIFSSTFTMCIKARLSFNRYHSQNMAPNQIFLFIDSILKRLFVNDRIYLRFLLDK